MNRVFIVSDKRKTEDYHKYFFRHFIAPTEADVRHWYPDLDADLEPLQIEYHTNCGGILEPISEVAKVGGLFVEYRCINCSHRTNITNYRDFVACQSED